MRRTLLVLAATLAILTGCSSSGSSDTAGTTTQDTTTETTTAGTTTTEQAEPPKWEQAPADTPEPPFVAGRGATPYLLDYGEILWVETDGIGRLLGPGGSSDCTPLLGGYDTPQWYDRYGGIPGFEGLVCNEEAAP